MLITLALPAYNEEDNIAAVLTHCVSVLKTLPHDWEIIVVDNASADGTAQKVREFSRHHPQVRLVIHESNRLYAGSCATALREGMGDRIAIMDSDGQHTPDDLHRFMTELDKGFSLVIGWRRHRHDPLARRIFSYVFNLMGKYYLRYPHHDLNCGFRMLNRSFAQQAVIQHKVNLANPEFFVRASVAGVRVGEIEVNHYAREKGKSTMTVGKICRMFQMVNTYFRSLRKDLHQRGTTATLGKTSSADPLSTVLPGASGPDASKSHSVERKEMAESSHP